LITLIFSIDYFPFFLAFSTTFLSFPSFYY
jgi:hypothetical protein